MALINCHECGAKVSTEAAACPGCGAKPLPPRPPSKHNALALVFLAVLGLVAYVNRSPSPPSPKPPPAPAQPAKTNTSDAATPYEKAAYGGAKLLKMNMRDPSSFQLESAWVMDNKAICYTYRARNGFGGLNLEHAVIGREGKSFLTQDMDGFATTWNRDCGKGPGHDYAATINAIMPLDH